MINTIALVAFVSNVVVGGSFVWTIYAGFERSVIEAGGAALGYSIVAIALEQWIADQIYWSSATQVELAEFAAMVGAVVGATIVLIGYRPEYGDIVATRVTTESDPTED